MSGDGIDPAATIALLRRLVQTDSVNPTLVPGAVGEGPIARLLADWLRRSPRLQVELVEVAPGRPNVIARLTGQGTGPTLLFNTHLDTVGVEHMAHPFAATIEGDRLYGRGAQDIKGGVAAMAAALVALADGPPLAGTVILAAVVDEEAASLGSDHLVTMLTADAAIVLEPTDMHPCLAHRGFAWLEVETLGRAAHGSRPAEGIDAIVKMGAFLAELGQLDRRLQSGARHPLVGPASVHAGSISGGLGLSTYPDRCLVSIERRTIPGEQPAEVVTEIEAIHSRLAAADPTYQAVTRLQLSRPPYEYDPAGASRLLTQLNAALAAQLGHVPEPIGHAAWMDSAILGAAGIPTIVFGPGGEGMHGAVEYVRLPEVITCASVLADLARRFCRVEPAE